MSPFEKGWIINPPHDYEFKYYKLLDGISKIKSLILDNKLYSAIVAVERELEILYNIKYHRDEIEFNTRIVTGIDVDNMSLSYDYPELDEDILNIYDICNVAIERLEKLYRTIRDLWRNIESNCRISEIPDKKVMNTMGYIMYIDPNLDKIKIYKYVEPITFKMDWMKFNLIKVSEIDNNLRAISTFIANSEANSDLYRFFRFDVKIDGDIPPFEECMFPLMKYSLFNRIKHGI